MSGDRYLLDTNAIIALLSGNQTLVDLTASATWLGISIISQLEFLAFENLSSADQDLFEMFLQRVEVVDLSQQNIALLDKVIELRKTSRLKLPDAIIAASALLNSASLVTADKAIKRVGDLSIIDF